MMVSLFFGPALGAIQPRVHNHIWAYFSTKHLKPGKNPARSAQIQCATMFQSVPICANHIQNYLFPEFILTSSSWFHLTRLTLSNFKSRSCIWNILSYVVCTPAPCHLQSCTPTWSPCQGITVQRVLVPFESVQILSFKTLRKSKPSSEL